mgnify:CR=1 FL=1
MDNYKINYKLSNSYPTIYPEILIKTIDSFQKIKKYKLITKVSDYQKINIAKDKIDYYYHKNKWDNIKKITNPFEYIYITNKKIRNNSISNYEPLSRSYFKMIEMCHEFIPNLIHKKESIKTLHLAEGPGGFIEGIVNMRHNKNDQIYGMTLISNNKEIPGWNRAKYFLKNNPKVKILLGVDYKGDLYNPSNHIHCQTKLETGADLITADGGFDFSVDYNLQEFLVYKLIYSQVICAIGSQKINGHFICKFFDIYSLLTCEIIYLCYMFYEQVYIFKPHTSRPANSEKYLICKNFKGIDNKYLRELRNILKIWNTCDDHNIICSIFKEIPNFFKEQINNIIIEIQKEQINCINKTIKLIENPMNHIEYDTNYKQQIKNAENWCNKYQITTKN